MVLPGVVAQGLFGPDGYEVVHGLGMLGELRVWEGGGRVRVEGGVSKLERHFSCGHELGHYADHLESWGLAGVELERACDVFAAAIMMPAGPFLEALGIFEDDWTMIASLFGVTPTAAILRAGELTGRPLAVVSDHSCRARGEAEWPPEQTLQRWTKDPGPGVVSARLRDDPKRYVLTASDDGPKSSAG